jgi:hypothetical protein
MDRNYYKADWAKFKGIVNTGCMTEIAEQRVWTPRHIDAACQKWYSPVLRAFNTVCPSTKIKFRDAATGETTSARKPRRRYMQPKGMHTGMPTINRS